MKLTLTAFSILTALSLASCRPEEPGAQEPQPQPPTPQRANPGVHTATVQEVIQASAYTYLNVKEGDNVFWIAVTKRDMKVGETVSFAHGLEMRDFVSKDLQRTFETIYFVSELTGGAPPAVGEMPTPMPHQTNAGTERLEISIDPAEGGIRIGELLSNPEPYADQTVLIRGQVTRVNRAILGRNWVHLQDGTGGEGNFDLTVTTEDEVSPGDVVTFKGRIGLNRDFGSGYAYEVLMEAAEKQD